MASALMGLLVLYELMSLMWLLLLEQDSDQSLGWSEPSNATGRRLPCFAGHLALPPAAPWSTSSFSALPANTRPQDVGKLFARGDHRNKVRTATPLRKGIIIMLKAKDCTNQT